MNIEDNWKRERAHVVSHTDGDDDITQGGGSAPNLCINQHGGHWTPDLGTYPPGDVRPPVIEFSDVACLERVDTCGNTSHKAGQGYL